MIRPALGQRQLATKAATHALPGRATEFQPEPSKAIQSRRNVRLAAARRSL